VRGGRRPPSIGGAAAAASVAVQPGRAQRRQLRQWVRPLKLPVMPAPAFDPEQRAREKQASREEDARALAAGEMSAQTLARVNGAFAFPRQRIRILEYP